jgi:Cu2+-exporting ATPase
VVAEGVSEVDESLLSGESQRVVKRPDAVLTGGSINMSSRLVMRVERVGADTVVAGIGRLLDRASAEKPRLAQLADRIAARFVAAVLAIAACAGLAWWFIDPAQALPIAVTVLVITCPCALSLATPAALAAATGSLTRLGVLITRGHALETLARATHFVFDKTGTLTTGELALVGVIPLGTLDRHGVLGLAAALERDSRHPLAQALGEAANQEACASVLGLRDIRDVAGAGVEGLWRGRRVRIGRPDFVAALCNAPAPVELTFVAPSVQVVALGDERGWLGLVTLSDRLRPQARALVRELRAQGREVWLLTGDRASVAQHVARELGIESVEAQARPEDKFRFVRELQQAGAVVAMIGDGVNDAPVLAQAQVSVAMGSGADIARASADMILAHSALARLRDILRVARRAERVIKQNLVWAAVYNAVAVPAAVLGLVTPLVASVGMAASSMIVIVNALRAAHPALWRAEPARAREPVLDVPAHEPSMRSA